jgi:dihydrofolate reductase
MRKVVVSLHVTLDGFAAGSNGEMDWIKFDDRLFDFVKVLTNNANTALYGRKTWQMMEAYWPTAGSKPDATKHDKEHSEWYNLVNKVVLSKSFQGKQQDKTEFLGDNIKNRLEMLKKSEGKDILIFGSPSVVRLLMEYNLIDEYWLFINPVILGKGISIYGNPKEKINLKLSKTKTFECGVIALIYSK